MRVTLDIEDLDRWSVNEERSRASRRLTLSMTVRYDLSRMSDEQRNQLSRITEVMLTDRRMTGRLLETHEGPWFVTQRTQNYPMSNVVEIELDARAEMPLPVSGDVPRQVRRSSPDNPFGGFDVPAGMGRAETARPSSKTIGDWDTEEILQELEATWPEVFTARCNGRIDGVPDLLSLEVDARQRTMSVLAGEQVVTLSLGDVLKALFDAEATSRTHRPEPLAPEGVRRGRRRAVGGGGAT